MTPHEIEARINAHREILITLMSAMIRDGRYDKVLAEIEEETVFQDGEEDPGVVPSKAFASEHHAADEIRLMLEAARARNKAR